ncbi:hypothetical protein HY990_06535 [Candidatus Micrarchaeota archaeon]|nr:hypothetical protein [Candidatus Micrarchaeota archaeon]
MAFEQGIYHDWVFISLGAAILSVVLTMFMIMIARLFNMPNFEQSAKEELTYAASTVLIVSLIAGGIVNYGESLIANPDTGLARCLYLTSFGDPAVSCSSGYRILSSTDHEAPTTLIDWMKLYLETPTNCVQSFMNFLYYLSIPVETAASVFMEIFMSEQASGVAFKIIAERIQTVAASLSFYMYVNYLMVHTLNFVKSYAGFFFSVGVALRAFPPTRGAGAYIMALTFGLYFVFPFSYILVATVSLPHTQAQMIQVDPSVSQSGGNFHLLCKLPANGNLNAYQCESPSILTTFSMINRVRSSWDTLNDMMTFRINDLAKHLVSAICIFPLIAFILLMTFVLNATSLLGGKIPEVGRGLIKLI